MQNKTQTKKASASQNRAGMQEMVKRYEAYGLRVTPEAPNIEEGAMIAEITRKLHQAESLRRRKGQALHDQQTQIARKLENAEALAEALREAIIRMDHLLDDASGEHSPTYKIAKAALARWDSGQ